MIKFTIRQLTYLTQTAQQGGIAQAARHLNVSAAAIASAIDKLEAVTKLTLFDRFPAQGMPAHTVIADVAAIWANMGRHMSAGVRVGPNHIIPHMFYSAH